MKRRLFIGLATFIMLTFVSIILVVSHLAIAPININIKNTGKYSYVVAYYSSINGRWTHAATYLRKYHTNTAVLRNTTLFTPAEFEVTVGGKQLGKSYCTANIEKPGLGRQAKFTHHQGHCQTFVAPNGELSLMVGKTNSIKSFI